MEEVRFAESVDGTRGNGMQVGSATLPNNISSVSSALSGCRGDFYRVGVISFERREHLLADQTATLIAIVSHAIFSPLFLLFLRPFFSLLRALMINGAHESALYTTDACC